MLSNKSWWYFCFRRLSDLFNLFLCVVEARNSLIFAILNKAFKTRVRHFEYLLSDRSRFFFIYGLAELLIIYSICI